MASMSGGISDNDATNNGYAKKHAFGRHPSNHHASSGILTQFRATELTILETALVYGFRHLADDDTRMRLLGILEQATAPLITKARGTTDR